MKKFIIGTNVSRSYETQGGTNTLSHVPLFLDILIYSAIKISLYTAIFWYDFIDTHISAFSI